MIVVTVVCCEDVTLNPFQGIFNTKKEAIEYITWQIGDDIREQYLGNSKVSEKTISAFLRYAKECLEYNNKFLFSFGLECIETFSPERIEFAVHLSEI